MQVMTPRTSGGLENSFPMLTYEPSHMVPMPSWMQSMNVPLLEFPVPDMPVPELSVPEVLVPEVSQAPATTELPTVNVVEQATPLMLVRPNLYAKLEGLNGGGSIYDRAVMKCTMGMLETGELKLGGTLCLRTSGNAGRSLLHVREKLAKRGIDIKVKLFMTRRYLTRDRRGCSSWRQGLAIHSMPHAGKMSHLLRGLDSRFMDLSELMGKLVEKHSWSTLDLHHDVNSLHAHQSTAEELMNQLPFVTDVVCTTGTGGTASGLRKYLPAHVNVHARPAKPGEMDGITDVRCFSNFCDASLLKGFATRFFDKKECIDNQKELQAVYNIKAGESSGAAYGLAKDILKENPRAQVVFICPDGQASKDTLYQSQISGVSNGEP